jgi:stage II sporulation protein D
VVVGTGGRTEVTGSQLRSRFGLRDTWMTFNSATADVEPPAEPPAPATPAPSTGGATAARAQRARVVGSAYPARPGTTVVLERRVGPRWARAGATHLGSTRRYKVTLPGPGRYRIVVGDLPGPTVRLGASR